MSEKEKTRRGRPNKPNKMSDAERMRLYRERKAAPSEPRNTTTVEATIDTPTAPTPPPLVTPKVELPEPRRAGQRKQRSDSVAAEIYAAMADERPELLPPHNADVPPEGMTDWRSIIASRNRDDWTHGELINVGQLVKYLLRYRQHIAMLEAEGDLMYDHHGKLAVNPRFALVDTLHRQIQSLMKALNITNKRASQATGGRTLTAVVGDSDGLLA